MTPCRGDYRLFSWDFCWCCLTGARRLSWALCGALFDRQALASICLSRPPTVGCEAPATGVGRSLWASTTGPNVHLSIWCLGWPQWKNAGANLTKGEEDVSEGLRGDGRLLPDGPGSRLCLRSVTPTKGGSFGHSWTNSPRDEAYCFVTFNE